MMDGTPQHQGAFGAKREELDIFGDLLASEWMVRKLIADHRSAPDMQAVFARL
jgi:hypothetical protein